MKQFVSKQFNMFAKQSKKSVLPVLCDIPFQQYLQIILMPVRNGNAKKGSSLEVLKKFNDLQGLNERFKPFFFVIGH